MPKNFLADLEGKQVLITGGTGWIGRSLVLAFLESGANVILFGGEVKRTVESLTSVYGENRIYGFDCDFWDGMNPLLEELAGRFQVDVIINNAYQFGRKTGFGAIGEGPSTPTSWGRAFESGVEWAGRVVEAFMAQFLNNHKGNIINTASMYGIVAPNPDLYEDTTKGNPSGYGIAKAGLIAYTRYMASFYGHHGIRCNAVAPGAIPNVSGDSYNSVDPHDEENFLKRLSDRTALKRYGTPDDLVGAYLYLASDISGYMTGQTLTVDGGWTIT